MPIFRFHQGLYVDGRGGRIEAVLRYPIVEIGPGQDAHVVSAGLETFTKGNGRLGIAAVPMAMMVILAMLQ